MARVSMILAAAFAMTFLWVGQATTTTLEEYTELVTTTAAVVTTAAAGGTTAAGDTSETVSGSFTVSGVSYADVTGDTQVEADFKSACAATIAASAGSGTAASMVSVTLTEGSVQVSFTITLPAGVTGSTLKSALDTAAGTSGTFMSSLSDAIGEISNLSATGSIGVTGFTAEVVVEDEEPSDKASHAGVGILSAMALAAFAGL
jgi:hypothetical protein